MISFAGLRRTVIAVATLLAALALWAAPASAIPAPQTIVALGDSITRGYNSAGTEFTPGACPMLRNNNPSDLDCPPNSWSTGTNPAVNSQFQRTEAINPDGNPVAINDAVSGARAGTDRSIDLLSQAQIAAAQIARTQGTDYVTIEIGANDACRPSLSAQTPTRDFRTHVKNALETLVEADPEVYIQLLSIPDVSKLWALFTRPPNQDALLRWSLFTTCQALLANPLSTAGADVARRAQFRAQVLAYNDILADECGQITRCLFDNDAVFNSSFTAADVATVLNTAGLSLPVPQPDFWDFVPVLDPNGYQGSTADYFHPSLSGQALLAEGSWNATFPMN
jgi:lysophospholipase L1-like esterase